MFALRGMPRWGASLVTLMSCGAGFAGSNVLFRTVALEGQQPPGLPPDLRFDSFTHPMIDAQGRVGFQANLTSTVGGFQRGSVFVERGGALTRVAGAGQPAPGTEPGVTFFDFSAPGNKLSAGNFAVFGLLQGPGVTFQNDRGLWAEKDAGLSLVVRLGQPAHGMTGPVYAGIGNALFNAAHQTAYIGRVTGSGIDSTNDEAIWSERTGVPALVARESLRAPGTPAGVVYSYLAEPVLNDAGAVAFRGAVTGPGVTAANAEGIWSDRSGTSALVVRGANAAPGAGDGVVFQNLGYPRINNAGNIAFTAVLAGPGITSSNRASVWVDRGGTLSMAARASHPAPGMPPGALFINFSEPPAINALGDTVFQGLVIGGGVTTSNNSGLWSQRGGTLELVAAEGSQAPGVPAGILFDDFFIDGVQGLDGAAINAAGQVAFASRLVGPGISGLNDVGIWAEAPDGALNLVAREGDPFEVAPGDTRTIRELFFLVGSGNEDGRWTSFNNYSQLAFAADFTDGSSGVFVAAVPEPSGVGVLAAVIAFLFRRR
jgi:hypothetical protein